MIYLASTSPRRKRILKRARISFRSLRPDYLEHDPPGLEVRKLVKSHALGKALSVLKKVSRGTVIGCDTVVYLKGKIIGKPKNLKHAFRILGALQGTRHSVYTGVAILAVKKSRITRKIVFCEKTDVTLNKMSRRRMTGYFRRINPLDKAGAYAIQSEKDRRVKNIAGSYLNVVGLPLERLQPILKKVCS